MLRPFAKDGTTLDETCRYKDGQFRVGSKGHEVKIRDLDEALIYMNANKLRHWRRPSATSGTPGVVVAVRWA